MGLKVGFVGFLHPHEENLPIQKGTPLLTNTKMCYKRNGLKNWLFGWFPAPLCDDHKCVYACMHATGSKTDLH